MGIVTFEYQLGGYVYVAITGPVTLNWGPLRRLQGIDADAGGYQVDLPDLVAKTHIPLGLMAMTVINEGAFSFNLKAPNQGPSVTVGVGQACICHSGVATTPARFWSRDLRDVL